MYKEVTTFNVDSIYFFSNKVGICYSILLLRLLFLPQYDKKNTRLTFLNYH